jgi:CBS domain containing-hemolysin-like protein
MILLRILLAAFAIVMIAFGVVAMIAPTPFGFVFVILGFLLLAAAAPAFIGKLRGHWPWLDRRLDALASRLPPSLARPLQKSGHDRNAEYAGSGKAPEEVVKNRERGRD